MSYSSFFAVKTFSVFLLILFFFSKNDCIRSRTITAGPICGNLTVDIQPKRLSIKMDSFEILTLVCFARFPPAIRCDNLSVPRSEFPPPAFYLLFNGRVSYKIGTIKCDKDVCRTNVQVLSNQIEEEVQQYSRSNNREVEITVLARSDSKYGALLGKEKRQLLVLAGKTCKE